MTPEDHSLAKKPCEQCTNPSAWPVRNRVHDDGIELASDGPSNRTPLPHERTKQMMSWCQVKANGLAQGRRGDGMEILVIIADEGEVSYRALR